MNLPDPAYPIFGVSYTVDSPRPHWSTELALAETDLDGLIDHLDLLLTYGTLSAGMRNIIKTALTEMTNSTRIDEAQKPQELVELAVYLFIVSPDYAIQL